MNKFTAIAVLVAIGITTTAAFDFNEWIMTTAESVHQHNGISADHGKRIDHQFDTAVQSMYARKAKHGLQATQLSLAGMDGILGWSLGVAYGLQYNPQKPGPCYSAIEATVNELDTIFTLAQMIYIPKYWADVIIGVQDWVKMSSSVYAYCDVQKFFNTMTATITGEGASTMGARVAGGLIFEIPTYIDDFTNGQFDSDKGIALGRLGQILFNYSIK